VSLLARRAFLGGTFTPAVPWSMMFLSWPSILWNYYLWHLLWPVNLTVVCDLPYATHLGWRHVILPATAMTALVAVVWIAARRRPAIGFAALWMGLLILPPLYLRAFAPGEIAHDRYLYLPSLGLSMLIAPALARLGGAGLATTAVLASLAALGVFRESQPWSNDIALFQRALVVVPGSVRAERQLALVLPAAGRCAEAIPILDRLRQQQEDPRVLLALGACYYGQSRFEEAGLLIERALALSPRYLPAHTILILTRLAQNRTADAETIWRRAVLAAGTGEARGLHLLGGQILKTRGDLPGAAAEFRLELAGSPESEEAARQLEEVEWTLGKRRAPGQ
jgi:tetratricopeptide (TPR) repeat protein